MDFSFELLSTMSPAINKNKKGASRKAPTKLALNKNIRRSICFDKLHEDTVILLEDSGDEFGDTSKIVECRDSKNSIIVIDSDSDCDENYTKQLVHEYNEQKSSGKNNHRDNVIASATSDDDSFNSAKSDFIKSSKTEISDSEGECNNIETFPIKNNFQKTASKNSEDADDFDKIKKWVTDVNKAQTNFDHKPTGDTFDSPDKSDFETLKNNYEYCKHVPVTPKCNVINDYFKTPNIDCESSSDEGNNMSPGTESILDQLYGESWRRNKKSLFLKSEQRTKNGRQNRIFKTAQTEPVTHHPSTEVDKYELQKKNLFHNFDSPSMNGVFKEKTKNRPKTEKPSRILPRSKVNGAGNFNSLVHKIQQLCDPDTSSSESEHYGIDLNKQRLFKKKDFQKTPKSQPRPTKTNAFIPESPMYQIQRICDPDITFDESDNESINRRLNIHGDCNIENDKNKPNLQFKKLIDDYINTTKKDSNEKKKGVVLKQKNITSPDNLFLMTLSADFKSLKNYDAVALIYKNNYKEKKEELAKKLFEIYNRNIFENKIDGDTPLEWNKNLRKTAGLCACRKITHRDGVVERQVRIVLSIKVVDSADRLRDTLLHEMCHAATWIIDEVSGGHGPHWKAWTKKAKITFPELPEVSVRHDYRINSKYTYKCTNCGYCIYRHTKSLNTESKRCGYCYGTFEVLLNKVSKQGSIHPVPVTPRKNVNGFAKFVQEHYANYRSPIRTHCEVMKLLGEKFAEVKLNKD